MISIHRMKISRILIAVAVVVWLPYLYLLSRGVHPAFMPFLAVHLLFIFLGVRVRGVPQSERPARTPRTIVGAVLIVLGVLAWVPYLYSKYVLHTTLEIAPYLILHLSGVLTGGFLRLSGVPTWNAFRRPIPDSKKDNPNDRN